MVQTIDTTELEQLFQEDIEKAFCKLVRFDYNTFKGKKEEWKQMLDRLFEEGKRVGKCPWSCDSGIEQYVHHALQDNAFIDDVETYE